MTRRNYSDGGTPSIHIERAVEAPAGADRYRILIDRLRPRGMAGPISDYLIQDHRKIEVLLGQATAGPDDVERSSYAAFRAGLLRHIGLEEKVLLPAARRARSGEPLPIAARLRRDHAALASLLVPTPTPEIVRTILDLLELHNPLEEGPGGLYETCDALLALDADAIVERLRTAPEVPVAPHVDGPRVREHVQALLLAARGRSPGSP